MAQASEVPAPLAPERLYRRTDPAALDFTDTSGMAPLPGLIHQPRAREAIGFGTCVGQAGFNIFAVGDTAGRVRESVRLMLDEAALSRPGPPDWVYVNNFADPQRPRALSLPAGRAPGLQKAVHDLIGELKAALPAMFESEDYQKQRAAAQQAIQAKGQAAFAALNDKAREKGIAILRTPAGFTLAPVRDGKIVPPADFNAWPREEQRGAQEAIESLEKDLEDTLRGISRLEKETRDAVLALERETARFAMEHPVGQVKAAYGDLPDVLAHLDAMAADLLENVQLFAARQEAAADPVAIMRLDGALERYEVNVVVSQSDHGSDAPVVEELNPTLANLVGRIEYLQMQGALVTNFRLIKAGALHRANGGTLLLDVRALLSEPYSWAALKRALTRGEIVIEDVTRFIGLTTTVSLEPDPIPLNVKIVLFGDRYLYYLLSSADPDLARHFKVLADFDDECDRTVENEMMLARTIGGMARGEKLKPLDRDAVARAIEHASRIAEDQTRLTLRVDLIRDLLTEVSHWAGVAGRAIATKADVEHAIVRQIARASRVRDLGQSMILRNIALVDTAGSRVGQINGLSVMSLGGFAFGKPARITCSVRPGAGRIVDIEREVELGGPLHSKGVLILSGYLAGRYGQDTPISLNASLVFEQSYGGVDGDSASSTELYALLSAISEIPLRQDIAVTGSVNQHGVVQAIGGANDKIEGYFDICAARGLTGTQGVMIPASNAQHLMLREDVVAACAAGKFSIWPIDTIDRGMALLTGRPMGERGPDGAWPEGSVNHAVAARLKHFVQALKEAGGKPDGDEKGTLTAGTATNQSARSRSATTFAASGAGFTSLFASPPAIGGTAAGPFAATPDSGAVSLQSTLSTAGLLTATGGIASPGHLTWTANRDWSGTDFNQPLINTGNQRIFWSGTAGNLNNYVGLGFNYLLGTSMDASANGGTGGINGGSIGLEVEPGSKGGAAGFVSGVSVVDASADATNREFVGLRGFSVASGASGTATHFALGATIVATSSTTAPATGWGALAGLEIATSAPAGSDFIERQELWLMRYSSDAAQGTSRDRMLGMWNQYPQGAARGTKAAIDIGPQGASELFFPVAQNGKLFQVSKGAADGALTIVDGFDITGIGTFTGNVFNSGPFQVDGTGRMFIDAIQAKSGTDTPLNLFGKGNAGVNFNSSDGTILQIQNENPGTGIGGWVSIQGASTFARIAAVGTPENVALILTGKGTGGVALAAGNAAYVDASGNYISTASISGKYLAGSVGSPLTAAGTTRADALALTSQINNVTTAAAATGVILPPAVTAGIGTTVVIFNAGANAIKVYGAGSDTIDGAAAATGVTLTNGKRCGYTVTAAATWISAQLGAISA